MGFPDVPEDFTLDIDLDPEQVALLLLVSIAFEELALAHVINVEAEKLQAAVGSPLTPGGTPNPDLIAGDLDELLDANRAAERMLRSVIKKEMLLQFKTEDVFDFLAGVTTTTPVTTAAACTCSLVTPFDVTITNSTATPIVPPVTVAGLIVPNNQTTLRVAADICGGCTPEENTFVHVFNRPAMGATALFNQTFTSQSFTALCTPLGILVTGVGTAIGTGTGSVNGSNLPFTLLLDQVLNTAQLLITNVAGTVNLYEQGPQPLPVDIVAAPCTTTI